MALQLAPAAGPEDYGHRLERVCMHEAGHVVAAWWLGISVEGVTVARHRGGGGQTDALAGPRDPATSLYWSLAGSAAESLAFGTVDHALGRSDHELALEDAARCRRSTGQTGHALVLEVWPQVRRVLTESWRGVEAVALALLEGPGTLTAAQVGVIRQASPVPA